jgi:hypothetical protein
LAQEFVQRWGAALCTEAEINEVGENTVQFTLNLSDIRLRTMHKVPCMLVSGGAKLDEPLRAFWNKFNSSNNLPFVLALSDEAREAAARELNSDRRMLLSAAQVKEILRADSAKELLKQKLREQIPRGVLIPFNTLRPAEGGMFFGRQHELNRLRDEDTSSFAIAGPGRVGKTSLARRYKNDKLHAKTGRGSRIQFIDLYHADPMPNKTARFIAMNIEPSRRSDRLVVGDLVNFLRYYKNRNGGMMELVLDEVDEVCQGEAFKALGEAARAKLCRLILCGRGVLLRMMLNSKSPLDCRLNLIQLGPLDDESARGLLVKPLTDLGFGLDKPDLLAGEVAELTGRTAGLIQLVGEELANRAIAEKTDIISPEHLEALKGGFIIAQTFIKSLNDLDNPEARLVALSLLDSGCEEFSVAEVHTVAQAEGLKLDLKRVNDVCIDLMINNVLVWHNGTYRVANGGLSLYSRKHGYLSHALNEARAAAAARPHP